MSVHGEFKRILGDTTAVLRVQGDPALAAALEKLSSDAGTDLAASARSVLDRLEASPPPDPTAAPLDHLTGICRVILGR